MLGFGDIVLVRVKGIFLVVRGEGIGVRKIRFGIIFGVVVF